MTGRLWPLLSLQDGRTGAVCNAKSAVASSAAMVRNSTRHQPEKPDHALKPTPGWGMSGPADPQGNRHARITLVHMVPK